MSRLRNFIEGLASIVALCVVWILVFLAVAAYYAIAVLVIVGLPVLIIVWAVKQFYP